MWFKNLRIYRLKQAFDLSQEQLQELLQERAFRPCGPNEPLSVGWAAVVAGQESGLCHENTGSLMICMRQEERLLPAPVINEAVAERVAAVEEAEARRVSRKEQREMRDEITFELLPKAFTKSSYLHAMIDRSNRWILVDAASAKRAEALLSLLRETLGSLPLRPLESQIAPAAVLTDWVREPESKPGFLLLDSCELRDSNDESAVIRCKGQDLAAEEIGVHLAAGKQVVKLGIEWEERISCSLESDLALKRLRFLDLIQEEAAEAEAEDAITRFDVDFALMNLELRRFLPRLLEQFGGLLEEE